MLKLPNVGTKRVLKQFDARQYYYCLASLSWRQTLGIMALLILFNFLPVLSIILKSKSPFELMNKPNMKDAIEALIPYSGKVNFAHNKRDTELIVYVASDSL